MGDFRASLELYKNSFNFYFIDKLLKSLEDVKNVTGNFLVLAEASFGLYELSKLSADPSKFFKSLGKDRSYITLAKIIESIFLSNEIKILNIDNFNLEIEVINKNQKLLAKYKGVKNGSEVIYIDKSAREYKGFKAGEYETLDEFVRVFLNRFIPLNKNIQIFNIIK